MKTNLIIVVLTVFVGLISCGKNGNAVVSASPEKDRVEVIYFHGKQRCLTCMAIEKNTIEVINTAFADDVKNGNVVFKAVDISTPEGEKIADKYEVTWSSLFVNKWKDGVESRNNMTEFGFGKARSNPDEFKTGLEEKISQLLK